MLHQYSETSEGLVAAPARAGAALQKRLFKREDSVVREPRALMATDRFLQPGNP